MYNVSDEDYGMNNAKAKGRGEGVLVRGIRYKLSGVGI